MPQTHEYTIEHIYHFTCGKCYQWWSYAQTELSLPHHIKTKTICPHCGHTERIKYKT